ncbi:hypothetical protein LTR78_008471 [Recurvomyces mirabilis]|uniref:Peptidase M43 pregnancy-associated plasma-A domain-containing protein n=1 Tax=Recurvomyces mirabilis TaxID=574656 RepID=A0AAE0TUT7_9PEZI|nr:hypothetical protein LTR78_008471 [Recurvomyces mirabilis]KAK5155459.1 hypothetical protein LTS14_005720 [Recurvomyces mirabilis]
MKKFVAATLIALVGMMGVGSTMEMPPRDATAPFGNATHYFDKQAGRMMKHFAGWSDGTYFKEQGTNKSIKHFDCDVTHGKASDHFQKTVQRLHSAHKKSSQGSRAARSLVERQTVEPAIQDIPLFIHVITTQAEAGVITQQMANDQAAALNTVYNKYGISFSLQGTTFTANDAWAVVAGADMDALKQSLRQGSYSALNLYFHTDLDGGMLGTCTLPSNVPPGSAPSEYFEDGCNCNAYTMPGSTMYGYNQGMTAVHETGHWLGLLHTFEGYACSGNGDFIADTPFESVSTNGCPESPWKNSCPGVSGGDPIRNYMDYSVDACYARFTAGQLARIGTMWQQYRQGQ